MRIKWVSRLICVIDLARYLVSFIGGWICWFPSFVTNTLAPPCYIEPFSRVVRPGGMQQQQRHHVTTPNPQEELAFTAQPLM